MSVRGGTSSLRRARIQSGIVRFGLIGVMLVWTLGPLYFLVLTSLKPYVATIAFPQQWWPSDGSLANYALMFSHYSVDSVSYRFFYAMRNSLIASTITTILNVAVGSAAAYVLARSHMRGKNALTMAFLASNLLPTVSLIIPFYVLTVSYLSGLHLYDTNTLLIILYTSFSLGLVIWIMRGYFDSIPIELEEAARMDGASRMKALIRIILPLAVPGLIATALLTFLTSWNNFILPLVLGPDKSAYNLPFFIYSLNGQYLHLNNEIAAGGVLAALPPVLIILFLGRHIVSGLTSGGVKG